MSHPAQSAVPPQPQGSPAIRNHAAFIWSVADLLRGDYKQSEYGKVILPLVGAAPPRLRPGADEGGGARALRGAARAAGSRTSSRCSAAVVGRAVLQHLASSTSPKLLDDPANIADNLRAYIAGLLARRARRAREVRLRRPDRPARPSRTCSTWSSRKFGDIDLHPDAVSNLEMGYLYEELIRRFSELSNETAGEHFTPREVIRLMVNLLFIEDDDVLAKPGVVRTLYDPACGTGGMLSVAEDHLRALNPGARLEVFGQELNAETYAICRSDMMIKGQDASPHRASATPSPRTAATDQHVRLPARQPAVRRGVEEGRGRSVKTRHEKLGFAGRFGAGLPRINDGSFLFLQHMISKMKPVEEGGSRLAIVFNGSPLFTGAAGSRRERDPPLDHRERLARSRRRPARPALLQHRHLHLLLDRHQPQAPERRGQGAA